MELIDSLAIRDGELKIRPAGRLRLLLPTDFRISFDPPIDLDKLPVQVSLLPFIWNVAPIIWATDQAFEIDVLDPRVAAALEAVRQELREMYPSLRWRGELAARHLRLAPDPPPSALEAASLYSGGVDSTWTALNHAGRKLLLVSVWGADVRLSDAYTWRIIATRNARFAERYAGAFSVVTSTFKSINYPWLATLTPEIPHWWSHIQMTMGTVALAAPLLYRHGIGVIRVPATVSDDYRPNYASLPRLDEKISLATACVEHDGFATTRQQKVQWLVDWQREHPDAPLNLRVCITWVTRDGGNCGRCEKCVRTIVALLIAGADPTTMGFPDYQPQLLESIPRFFPSRRFRFLEEEVYMWRDLQAHARRRPDLEGAFWSWLRTFDFEAYRLRQPVGFLSWARFNRVVARMPRVVAVARGARRLVRRVSARVSS